MNPLQLRNIVTAGSAVLFHIAALWALQSGLLRRAVEVFVPVSALSELMEPPRPRVEPPTAPKQPEPVKHALVRKAETLPPPPMPIAIADPMPAPRAPVGIGTTPAALPLVASPVAVNPEPVAQVAPTVSLAPPKVELPSSDADYLQNPKPAYPAQSRRMGEQGRVLVRVLIGIDGAVQKTEVSQSSGFGRLDQAALATVQRWRFVPGKRGGAPEAMWFNVPLNFILE